MTQLSMDFTPEAAPYELSGDLEHTAHFRSGGSEAYSLMTNGSSFKAYLGPVHFGFLQSFLGIPAVLEPDENEKVQCEWILHFPNRDRGLQAYYHKQGIVKSIDECNAIATVYDWKTGIDPHDNEEWHIGGHSKDAMYAVYEALTHWLSLENRENHLPSYCSKDMCPNLAELKDAPPLNYLASIRLRYAEDRGPSKWPS